MNLKKLFEDWKVTRKNRKKYRLRLAAEFHVADDPFIFYIIPTIVYIPWFHLIPDSDWDRMFTFVWLNFGFTAGKLERAKEIEENVF